MIFVNARAVIERNNVDTTEIVIQTRNKPEEEQRFELPGGQINKYESLIDALKREVFEETGLIVTEINGVENRVDTSNMGYKFSMECVKPFAVYQTLEGPVDSMGVYFKCKAEGKLCRTGDCTKDVRWINIKELHSLIQANPLLFSDIDRAGFLFYLNENF